MKLLKLTVRNILILAIFLTLAVALLWLVRRQTLSSLTAQANTPTLLVTTALSPTDIPTLAATDTSPSPSAIMTVVPIPSLTYAPGTTATPLFNADTPVPGPTYTPTPILPTNDISISSEAKSIKVINEQQITGTPSDSGESCNTDYYSYVSWSPDSQFLLASRPTDKSFTSGNITLVSTDMWRFSTATQKWEMLIPNAGTGLWSPDGTKILYSSLEDTNTKSIFVADSNGKNSQIIAKTGWTSPLSWMGNSNIVYFSNRENMWRVYKLQDKVTPLELEGLAKNIQTLSPTTQEIQFAPAQSWAVYRQGKSLVIDQVGKTRALTDQLSSDPGIVAWSSDGRKLAYVTTPPQQYSIWIFQPEISANIEIITSQEYLDKLSWFPDGKSVLFEKYEGGGGFLIQIVNIDNGELTDLLRANPASPQLSPNGKTMAFFRECNLWLATLSYPN